MHRFGSDFLRVCALVFALSGCGGDRSDAEWPVYGGNASGDRYSELTDINRETVAGLKEVWRFDAGTGGLQTSPLMVDGRLYVVTADKEIVALDPSTGEPVWRFDGGAKDWQPVRGLSYWAKGRDRRLFVGIGSDLLALDAATGEPIKPFGADGKVDLREGLGRDRDQMVTFMTSPGAVYRDLIITGFRTAETAPASPGAVRAYDVKSGALRWTFNLIPRPGEPGHETWPADAWKTAGGANSWAGMAVDARRGIVFAPTGSAVDDFYGGDRQGDNLYANSLVALDAATGKRLWNFQMVRHDLWDRDLPSPPTLLTVRQGGRTIDAVAQATKQGVLFVFERATGKPLFPIEDRPAAPSDVPGESAAPMQPFPVKPEPFARQRLTADMLTRRTPAAHAAAQAAFAGLKSEGPYTPLTVGKESVVFPGFDGGAEWGGAAVDRETGVVYINSNDIAWTGGLAPMSSGASPGAALYQQHCGSCHGAEMQGAPPDFPGLAGVFLRLTPQDIAAVIAGGRGRMPAFPQLSETDRRSLTGHLYTGGRKPSEKGELGDPNVAARFTFTGYKKFLDPDGYPAVAPPWGTLNAIDLNTGEYLWKIPLGEYPELAAKGVAATGTENYGGPIVTAGGIVVIGATIYDRKLRAFDSRTGELLFEGDLPYAGTATPITYKAKGRQFIVIATSGARDPKAKQGAAYVAFSLPPSDRRSRPRQ